VNEEDIVTEKGDATGASTEIEVPVHPFCAVFDLRRHLRLRVHVNFLKLYKYDLHMDTKLILPKVTKDLVSTLIAQSRTGFSDIIEGKGLGVAVLLGGPPGVGKTLTAEVFAEASERPLYSIQAAQLGIKADEVEKNLAQFLARGSRWNAIVLIDEADVYIRSRDRDMEHNAIVASLLRVLEYQTSILFMTTNLAKEVDDAIVSRCIARINYGCPSQSEQSEIWKVIADLNSIRLEAKDIAENVKRHPNLTGRDIKQLLKLAVLHSAKDGGIITPEVIDFVAQFQPTINENGGTK
jgi:SpoVK/Ycf46/Vps4 family AAA+-type ATPase